MSNFFKSILGKILSEFPFFNSMLLSNFFKKLDTLFIEFNFSLSKKL
jgi:hypothetical protein